MFALTTTLVTDSCSCQSDTADTLSLIGKLFFTDRGFTTSKLMEWLMKRGANFVAMMKKNSVIPFRPEGMNLNGALGHIKKDQLGQGSQYWKWGRAQWRNGTESRVLFGLAHQNGKMENPCYLTTDLPAIADNKFVLKRRDSLRNKGEFRDHREAPKEFLQPFFKEWEAYRDNLIKSKEMIEKAGAAVDESPIQVKGKTLSSEQLNALDDEKRKKLDDLRNEIRKNT
eukprot:g1978.t1